MHLFSLTTRPCCLSVDNLKFFSFHLFLFLLGIFVSSDLSLSICFCKHFTPDASSYSDFMSNSIFLSFFLGAMKGREMKPWLWEMYAQWKQSVNSANGNTYVTTFVQEQYYFNKTVTWLRLIYVSYHSKVFKNIGFFF